ncbi:transposase [Streptomyces sp. NPDC051561]|uniref:transposase n=1 Tax=Streptomyces sp. NPDC051561 TaxID=3365658 RepID=UPI0037B378E0
MSMRKPYSTDVSDEQWVLVEPVIAAWKAAHPSVSGHQGRYAMRDIVNAILYQNRAGCQWDLLPHDLPPAGAVKYYFYKWRDDGTDQTIHDLLRWQLRERNRRLADPSLIVMDTQSIRAAVGVPADTTGKDASKRVPGRKRCLAVDVSGLVVLSASAHDNAAGIALLNGVAAQMDTVKKAWSTRGSRRASSTTARTWASMSRSWNAIRRTRASSRRPSGGSWSRRTGSCCSTGAWSATTTTGCPPPAPASCGR